MIAILLVLALAAPGAQRPAPAPQPERLPANGRVATPEGIRFELPPGQEHSTMTEDGARAYLSRARDGATSVLVRPFRVEAPLTCSGAAEPGSNVVEFRTKRGLAGCLVSGVLDDAGRFAAVAVVRRGEAGVMVLAAGATDGIARGLASRVAESVEIGEPARRAQLQPLVRNEPRMVGCFERALGVSNAVTLASTRGYWTRCFREDATFTQSFEVGSMGDQQDSTGAFVEPSVLTARATDRHGRWACSAERLFLVFDDGDTESWDLTFGDSGVLLGKELWTRTSKRPDSADDDQAGDELE